MVLIPDGSSKTREMRMNSVDVNKRLKTNIIINFTPLVRNNYPEQNKNFPFHT